jgi:hypothetical protein
VFKNRFAPYALLITCGLQAAPARSQDRITARDLVSIKVPSQLGVSPDGRKVAFVVDEADFERSRANKDLYLWSEGETRRLPHPGVG